MRKSRAVVCLLTVAVLPLQAQDRREAEIRFLCFAPSPYSHRHDAMRAGLGIFLRLSRLIQEHQAPAKATFYDAVPALSDKTKAHQILRGAKVLVFGSSTWSQGSPYLIRQFFEYVGDEYLGGVAVTAWATAGGSHTGGEVTIADTLRSAMGSGASVFSLGQRYMVFTTDERLTPEKEGEFTLLDCWFMDQFARNLLLVAMADLDRERAAALSKTLRVKHQYYQDLPSSEAQLKKDFGELQRTLNRSADQESPEFKGLLKRLTSY
jgi:hypothetical protein